MDTKEQPQTRYFRVGQRVYRKTCKRDRRRRPVYVYPELKLSNAWLQTAGFQAGDMVAVRAIGPGSLVIVRVPTHRAPGPRPDAPEPELPIVRW